MMGVTSGNATDFSNCRYHRERPYRERRCSCKSGWTPAAAAIASYCNNMRLTNDPRNAQISFLALFLLLGVATRDWTVRPAFLLVAIASCLCAQWFFASFLPYYQSRQPFGLPSSDADPPSLSFPIAIASWRSALITALGLCLLLRANHWQTIALAGALAIASKFAFRARGKHWFNPANFGIIAALTFTGDAWVSPGQWGTDGWYVLLFLGAGGLVLQRVGRWDTTATFLATFAGLEWLRNAWLGWESEVFFHQLSSGSLLLFALFMLTDPRSIPNATASRMLWAIAVAVATFLGQHWLYLSTAPFWALFFLAPVTPLLDAIWKAPRFRWLPLREGRSLLSA